MRTLTRLPVYIGYLAAILMAATAIFPQQTVAQQGEDLSINFKLPNPLKGTDDLPAFLEKMLDGMVILLTPVVVIMLLYSGFLFVTAHGNAEKLTEAKKAFMYTLIGAAIVLGASGLAKVIHETVKCLGDTATPC